MKKYPSVADGCFCEVISKSEEGRSAEEFLRLPRRLRWLAMTGRGSGVFGREPKTVIFFARRKK